MVGEWVASVVGTLVTVRRKRLRNFYDYYSNSSSLNLCFLHLFPYDRLPGKKTRTKDPGKKAPVHCDLLTP